MLRSLLRGKDPSIKRATRIAISNHKLPQQIVAPGRYLIDNDIHTSLTRSHSSMAPAMDTVDASSEPQKLPKLSPSDYRQYNHMAEHMDMFHNHFRQDWNMMYSACTNNKRPGGMSIRAFLQHIDQFCSMLTMHHTIEEQRIFPVLAKKMPAFREELELLTHHQLIHEGIERLEKYTDECRTGETEFRLAELKRIMDTFGSTLWEHLDAEVAQLGAENMRKYWSLDEMRRMPM